MFNFFKKKKGEEQLPKEDDGLINKADYLIVENKKICLGVILEDMNQESLDALLLCFNRDFKHKIFSDEQIGEFSQAYNLDVTKHFHFIDYTYYKENRGILNLSSTMRFLSNNVIGLEGNIEVKSKMDSINKEKFYDRVEIEKLSEDLGFSVYDRCEFKDYSITKQNFKDSSFIFLVEEQKTSSELRSELKEAAKKMLDAQK